MKRLPLLFVVFCSLLMLGHTSSVAQRTSGKWTLGVRGGANMLVNDFNERKPGPGGEISLRYGATRFFSLGITGGYEELKALQKPPLSFLTYDYVKLHAIPLSINGWFHLSPGSTFSPYFYVGGGVMFYKRKDGVDFLPDDKFKTSILIPMGVGFEAFTSSNVSVNLDLGYRVGDDKLDAYEYKKADSYASAKVGLNFYLGSSSADDDDNDGLTNSEEQRLGTNPKVDDTDGDGLKDGEEVRRYSTNPLKTDTDGDGLSDGDEVFIYKTEPSRSDSDGDGLADGEEILKYKTDPLKLDTDGDGLPDGEEVLTANTNPLKVDTDGDGVSDWDEVKIYKSDPNRVDTDADGLSDGDEVTKYKSDPTRIDTDGGGVNDGAEVARGTNPLNPRDDVGEKTIILEKGKSVLLEGVTFNTGSAVLTRESEKTLEKAFIALVANPDIRVEIAGYTDNVGSAELNDRLSRRRAEAVRAWLVRKGIPGSRMTAVGMGMKDPIASNDTAEGRAENRRIEFHVLK